MYDRRWYDALRQQIKQLDANGELRGEYTLLLQVELGLYLQEQLGLSDEPAQVLWLMLSGLPLPSLRLTTDQQAQRARARILLPYFSGRFAWESALKTYRELPLRWRAYTFVRRRPQRTNNHAGRFDVYHHTLTTPLARQRQSLPLAQGGETVEFVASLRGRTQKVRLTIDNDLGTFGTVPLPWLTGSRPRQPFSITFQELTAAAQAMDQQEINAAARLRATPSNWGARIQALQLRPRHQDGSLGPANSAPLTFDGSVHLAGMVSSGKSNLMKVLAFLCTRTDRRVTLIVGDTMSALELADYYNRLLCAPGEPPIAVPLLGQTTKNSHLQRLYASQNFQQYPDHWGLRWLSTDCPLLSLPPHHLPEPVIPGNEPCQTLSYIQPGTEDLDEPRPLRACPLFAVCPSKQLFRDIPTAQIWITTPGALGAGNLPAQAGPERMKYWELVYEHSDLVIFDEVDAVQAWFDQVCAPQVTLADGSGLLDRIDPNVATTWARRRARPRQQVRWVQTARTATSAMGLALSELDLSAVLEHWVEHKYFTAQSLLLALTYRLFGVTPLVTDAEANEEGIWLANVPTGMRRAFKQVLSYFEALLEGQLSPSVNLATKQGQAIHSLAAMVQSIILSGAIDFSACQTWLLRYVPGLGGRLAQLPQATRARRRRRTPEIPETIATLGERLGLALCVAILDRDMRRMFDEWQNSLVNEQDEERLKRAPLDLQGILPIPPTGRLFGFSHHIQPRPEVPLGDPDPVRPQALTVFEYAEIGRWFVLHFHELLASISGEPGPHVLALSGTSWLPNSSRWHFATPPQAVLEADPAARQAIAQSAFAVLRLPHVTHSGSIQPLAISGTPDMRDRVREAAHLLASGAVSPLLDELQQLEALGRAHPAWKDRKRALILVNSYEQAEVVARELGAMPGWRHQVYGLKRGEEYEDRWVEASRWSETLDRGSIERFAQTQGTVLVAPLQAIGRGYNILNATNIAAFGAIYFLIRLMPHPYDLQGYACELNRLILEWCADSGKAMWRRKGIYQQGLELRGRANRWWHATAQRQGYASLSPAQKKDLAASMAGLVIQACGRLLRGGVPFHAYFVDAKWVPRSTNTKRPGIDTPNTSLLAAMLAVLETYTADPIGAALYQPLVDALRRTTNCALSTTWSRPRKSTRSTP